MKVAKLMVAEVKAMNRASSSFLLRKEGLLPASVVNSFGGSTEVLFRAADYYKMNMHEGEEIDVEVDGHELTPFRVRISGIEKDPVLMRPKKVVFDRLKEQFSREVEVVFHLVGKSLGEAKGGVLVQSLRRIKLWAKDAPVNPIIDVDVSRLDINDAIYLGDLHLPGSFELRGTLARTPVALVRGPDTLRRSLIFTDYPQAITA